MRYIREGRFNLRDMVTMVLPLSETKKAMETLDSKPADMIIIVLKP